MQSLGMQVMGWKLLRLLPSLKQGQQDDNNAVSTRNIAYKAFQVEENVTSTTLLPCAFVSSGVCGCYGCSTWRGWGASGDPCRACRMMCQEAFYTPSSEILGWVKGSASQKDRSDKNPGQDAGAELGK